MEYVEVLPRPELRPIVRRFWSLRAPRSAGSPSVDRVVPDGCPELVLHRADPFERREGGSWRRQAGALAVGQLRSVLELRPTGASDLVGIRFEPGGLFALLAVPMHSLADRDVELAALAPRLEAELRDALGDRALSEAQPHLEQVIARWLSARSNRRAGSSAVAAAVRAAHGAPSSVGALAARVGVGRRTLERAFRDEVGLTPKRFLRVLRLQAVLAHLEDGRPARSWADLAYRFGFADQPHLVREFRELAGRSPERFLAERTPLAGVFESRDLSRSSKT